MVRGPVSMLYPSLDPNERFRERRRSARRRKRQRRAIALGVLLLGVFALAGGMTLATKGGKRTTSPAAAKAPKVSPGATVPAVPKTTARGAGPRALPLEVRGIHVTGPLLTLPGKLDGYLALTSSGLNTIELDVKDEGGIVNYEADVPLARLAGATRPYYDAAEVARKIRAKGIYLIGRIVVFQDPLLARARPDLAIRRDDGSVWATSEGLGWLNPYDRRTWGYTVAIAKSAVKAGFDEIMFDYVRFPTDGDIENARYTGSTTQPRPRVIEDFLQYARRQLGPNVRISAALFGLAATRDMGIGQVPRLIGRHVDAIAPMAYPALYGSGELGIERPSRQPGETVFRTLADFRQQVGDDTLLIPWIQDWSYSPDLVRAQVEGARLQGAKGFLLWNAEGIYTASALRPAPSG